MGDWIKQVFENKIVSQLIVVLIVGMMGFYVGTIKNEAVLNAELKIITARQKAMEGEIALLKIRQDQLDISIQGKANKSTIDQCLRDVNIKLDNYTVETNKRLDRILELILKKQ